MITTREVIEIKKKDLKAEINPTLKARFSPRVFSKDPISEEDLKKIFEAARWAPSSYNRQPWFFYVAKRGTKAFEKLTTTLMEGNFWAKGAPLLILACYIKEDEMGENKYAQYDLGQAVFSLVFQAQELGIYSHQIAGFDKKAAKELLNLPKEHEPWVLIAMGRLGDYSKAEEKWVKKDLKPARRKDKVYKILP
jgi:nitroreductase